LRFAPSGEPAPLTVSPELDHDGWCYGYNIWGHWTISLTTF
jgi:hypothetical protein